jgi:hypothetical protein
LLHYTPRKACRRREANRLAAAWCWHGTPTSTRWLDPLQHDGSATPDNFLMEVHDALIKNYKAQTLGSFGAGRPPVHPGESATFAWSERDIHYLQAG